MNPGTCSYVLDIRHNVLVVHFENPSWHDSFLISLSDDDFIKSSTLYMDTVLSLFKRVKSGWSGIVLL